jgi:hypothetical protein
MRRFRKRHDEQRESNDNGIDAPFLFTTNSRDHQSCGKKRIETGATRMKLRNTKLIDTTAPVFTAYSEIQVDIFSIEK